MQIIALTSFKEDELVHGALEAGAIGYLLKNVSADELAVAIRQPDSPPLSPEELGDPEMDSVTSQEGEIFRAEEDQIVRYRVEVSGSNFAIVGKSSYIFRLEAGKDSTPVYFELIPKLAGSQRITVLAYQLGDADEGDLVAQTRLRLTAVVAAQ